VAAGKFIYSWTLLQKVINMCALSAHDVLDNTGYEMMYMCVYKNSTGEKQNAKKNAQIMYPQRYCRWRFIFLLNILSGILHDSLSGISLGTNLYMLTAAKFKQVSSTFGSILSNIFFGHPLQHFNTICLLAGILL